MKKTIREPVRPAYSLHDMDASLEAGESTLVLRLPSGMIKSGQPCRQTDGRIEFHGVDWGFCYLYLFDTSGNVGPFSGEKFYLKDFMNRSRSLRISIADEVYGYNQTKYFGYLSARDALQECIVEVYHEGEMVFIEE